MDSFRDVIDAFGGTEKFRNAVGVEKYPTAAGWYRRNSIPGGWWKAVVSAAECAGVAGIDLPTLASIASRTSAAGRAAE